MPPFTTGSRRAVAVMALTSGGVPLVLVDILLRVDIVTTTYPGS
jgi:hypothetical protein